MFTLVVAATCPRDISRVDDDADVADDDDALLCIYAQAFCVIHKRPHETRNNRVLRPTSPLDYARDILSSACASGMPAAG